MTMRNLQATRRLVRLATIAAALALATPAAQAQNASPAAMLTAAQIVKVTGATALFNPLVAGVVEQAKVLFLQQNPALGKDVNEIATKMRADLTPRLSEVANDVARNYATQFSEQELKDLLTFYQSPLGQKVIKVQPQIVDASLKFAQEWANKLSEEVVEKMRVELKKKGHAL
jgi:hypothetical protein